jgi:hypothetical protein
MWHSQISITDEITQLLKLKEQNKKIKINMSSTK